MSTIVDVLLTKVLERVVNNRLTLCPGKDGLLTAHESTSDQLIYVSRERRFETVSSNETHGCSILWVEESVRQKEEITSCNNYMINRFGVTCLKFLPFSGGELSVFGWSKHYGPLASWISSERHAFYCSHQLDLWRCRTLVGMCLHVDDFPLFYLAIATAMIKRKMQCVMDTLVENVNSIEYFFSVTTPFSFVESEEGTGTRC